MSYYKLAKRESGLSLGCTSLFENMYGALKRGADELYEYGRNRDEAVLNEATPKPKPISQYLICPGLLSPGFFYCANICRDSN